MRWGSHRYRRDDRREALNEGLGGGETAPEPDAGAEEAPQIDEAAGAADSGAAGEVVDLTPAAEPEDDPGPQPLPPAA